MGRKLESPGVSKYVEADSISFTLESPLTLTAFISALPPLKVDPDEGPELYDAAANKSCFSFTNDAATGRY